MAGQEKKSPLTTPPRHDSGAQSERNGTLFFFGISPFSGLDNQRIRNQLPNVFHFHIHEVILFAKTLHDLVATIVTRSDQQLRPRIFDLFRLNSAVENPLLHVGSSPGTAAGAAAEVVGPIRVHFDEILAALTDDPARLLVIPMTKRPLALPPVVAGVVKRREMVVNGLVDFDSAFLDVLLQQIVYAEELNAFVSIPFLQTKPGRIVGVPSLG